MWGRKSLRLPSPHWLSMRLVQVVCPLERQVVIRVTTEAGIIDWCGLNGRLVGLTLLVATLRCLLLVAATIAVATVLDGTLLVATVLCLGTGVVGVATLHQLHLIDDDVNVAALTAGLLFLPGVIVEATLNGHLHALGEDSGQGQCAVAEHVATEEVWTVGPLASLLVKIAVVDGDAEAENLRAGLRLLVVGVHGEIAGQKYLVNAHFLSVLLGLSVCHWSLFSLVFVQWHYHDAWR